MASKNDEDAFLQFLAEEGRVVGQAAKRLFRNGTELKERDSDKAAALTKSALSAPKATLYEGCAVWGNFVTRPDVLMRDGNRLLLIEVKSKVGDMRAHLNGSMLINIYDDIRAAWKEYVHDLAFQVAIFSQAFPEFEIVPFLLLPEQSAIASVDEVEAVRASEFMAGDLTDEIMRKRRSESVLKFFPAQKAIDKVHESTLLQMQAMERAWQSGVRPDVPLRYQCRNCEFRLDNGRNPDDGFHVCWGQLAKPDPHVFDLYQLYSLKQADNKQSLLSDQKIQQGTTSLYDVSEDDLHGEHANRQRIQLRFQKSGEEWIDPALKEAIGGLSWPIAFLDFETSMAAVPWYGGMKPYELMPFQFSAHILEQDGSWRHVEWLNLDDEPPTLEFIRQLKGALEGAGSILVFTDYENRVLADSIKFLLRQDDDTETERAWISELLSSGRIVDQHQWVYDFYFHPLMAGKTSIKKVLPAVWNENPELHSHPYFKQYVAMDESGVINPYKTLPSKKIAGVDWEVREGCAAMTTYRELIRGAGAKDPAAKAELADLLRQYVTVDTASQWMIFEHWRQHFAH